MIINQLVSDTCTQILDSVTVGAETQILFCNNKMFGFTFLFGPLEAAGHINACIGIAEQLRDRGHKVVFATPIGWKGQLESQGFHEELYSTSPELYPTDKWGELIANIAPALAVSPEDQPLHLHLPVFTEAVKQLKFSHARLNEIVSNVKPDLIVVDTVIQTPALVDAGVPWVTLVSMNPLAISPKNVPPPFAGYPTGTIDKTKWEKYDLIRREAFADAFEDYKSWVLECGGPELKFEAYPFIHKHSSFANIYMYPKELDYLNLRPNPPNWYQFDGFVRSNNNESFQIPDQLHGLPGKLIYLSMGTIGCSEIGLMKRLIGILAKSKHRFIVSKGPLADKFELADNMWGAPSVPQIKVLPLVDLVITHGGNNTIMESFYFGKRVLVLPLFCDQLDNAQRVHETGLGWRLHPYQATEMEMLDAIEKLLIDNLLKKRMIAISQRIQASNGKSRAADLLESVVNVKYGIQN